MSIIQNTQEHLKKIYPWVKDVKIKVHRLRKGEFISKIDVRTPWKSLHAEKIHSSVMGSLEKTCEAIERQMEKIKTRRFSRKVDLEKFY